jgi:hypothetical protein
VKKLFLAIVLLFFPLMATAVEIDHRNLTQEQVLQLKAQAAAMAAQGAKGGGTNISATVRSEAAAWSELGANIGTAMVSAAKELGVAANEFSQTGLGKVVTVLLVYKMFGPDLIGLAVGSIVLFGGLFISAYILMSTAWASVKYEYKPMLFGLWNKRVVASVTYDSDATVSKTISAVVTALVALVVGLNCIF